MRPRKTDELLPSRLEQEEHRDDDPQGPAPDRAGSDEHADDDEEDRGIHRVPDDGIDAGRAKARAGDRDGARREGIAECA